MLSVMRQREPILIAIAGAMESGMPLRRFMPQPDVSLVTLYIGSAQDCNLQRLQEIAEKFSLDWSDFWHWYHGPERKESKKSKGKVVQPTEKCITSTLDLEAELQRLQLALEEMTADRDRQLIRIADLQNRMRDEIKKAIAFQGKQLERLEAYNREIDRANGYLEKDNARLREENQKLKTELESLRSNVSVFGQQENDEIAANHPWSIGSIQPRSVLLSKSKSRHHFETQGNYPVLPDGSKWRRLGSKQDLPESERCLSLHQYYPANTVLYLCIG